MNTVSERLINGIIKENPTFVLMLGMCPTMAVTTSGINAVGMGLSTAVVLTLSNVVISMLRKIIPDKVRIPAFIVIIASFVTVVQMLMQGYLPSLYSALGIYIPLIVVNCIILGRAESWAYKNTVISSAFDGIGMGLGFTLGLTCIGVVRELIGAGTVFGFNIMPAFYKPATIFIMAPGAFFVLAALVAIMNAIKLREGKAIIDTDCAGDCGSCAKACSERNSEKKAEKTEENSDEKKSDLAEGKEVEE